MIVNARMKDGRTTFQFASRADLLSVLNTKPENLARRQRCWVKHHVAEEHPWFETTVLHLNANSVAWVMDARTDPLLGLPAEEVADQRRRKYEEAKAREEVAA